ncbi:Aste57867_881 [Aphanomyces stellatus]|uniref:Aste57867_881 protein n=1 Tax=Aphanomyces stellatus TaxID=120398 RepID=A0A485K3R1_9STRA|nr:hypothetical protein As57867_000880 [Aphanomyces stellatus]VFT78105.1 Aste57867_881 [Aphanomyces stellatus]
MFRAVAAVELASRAVIPKNSFLHHAYALSETGMAAALQFGMDSFSFETAPETVARQKIDTMTFPFHEDGLDFWAATRSFVSNYLDLHYTTARPSKATPHWSSVQLEGRHRSVNSVDDAMQNHLGGIAEYISDPGFTPPSWVEGALAARPRNAIRVSIIMASTGHPFWKTSLCHARRRCQETLPPLHRRPQNPWSEDRQAQQRTPASVSVVQPPANGCFRYDLIRQNDSNTRQS